MNLCAGSVEVLEFQFPHVTAVHRVCPVTSEFLDIEIMGTHADFLIGVESDADIAMFHLLVIPQPAHRLYDLGNTSLVVCT